MRSRAVLETLGREMSSFEIRYQATASEDRNRLRILACVWQWFINCSQEVCVKVFNKSDYESKLRLYSLHTPDSIHENKQYVLQFS
jgi:hypothetical protein